VGGSGRPCGAVADTYSGGRERARLQRVSAVPMDHPESHAGAT
jgi:hypothetical protein